MTDFTSQTYWEGRLSTLLEDIAKTRRLLQISSGDTTVVRQRLDSLLEEEKYVRQQLAKVQALGTSSASRGGPWNKAQFERPS